MSKAFMREAFRSTCTFLLALALFFPESSICQTPDFIELHLDCPSADVIRLSWTGGAPSFHIYRAVEPTDVGNPAHLVAVTADRTVSLPEGENPSEYFAVMSTCIYDPPERCDLIDNDCDGSVDEAGAESSCVLPHAAPACIAGVCQVGSCEEGYGNCDGEAWNGCEILIAGDDPGHCGSCDIACSANHMATVSCGGGVCNGTCAPLWGDCNLDKAADGCETDLSSSQEHCGECGNPCIGGEICQNGACQCPAGQYFCSSSASCVTSCASCTGAAYGCAGTLLCVADCTIECTGWANCPLNSMCVAACASCAPNTYTCTRSGSKQCVNKCNSATCPAPSTCI